MSKIYVYAISKNEEKFVDRWVTSMKEADGIYVLDTGSTDKTVEKLINNNVNVVSTKITPWRFDVARNKSLELVPIDADICVCTDLDEVFEKGWRDKLEKAWISGTTRARYNYNWSFNKFGKPEINFFIEKIHSRIGYKWTHPVHEVLKYENDNEKFITIEDITVNHYPDTNKSRSSYLPLLELSVKEDPKDDRNMHYLGREYMYYQRYQECIDTLIKHLHLETATWKDERCASMRFIGRSYKELKRYDEAIMWYKKAIKEAPYLRDPYLELGMLYYILNDWNNVITYLEQAKLITYNAKSYINESFSWDSTLYDLLSLAYYYKNNKEKCLENINIALELNSENERLINNKKIFDNM